MSETSKQYFPALTGFRAVAAMMVYLSHYNPLPAQHYGKTFVHHFFSELQAGVGLFFVLSGFLICNNYYHFAKSLNWKWFGQYMRNRFVRIYPVYFILTLATFIYYRDDGTSGFDIFIYNITFLRGFSDCYLFSGIMQGWSLSVEEVFYLLAPLLFFFISVSRNQLLRLTLIVLFFLGLTLLIWSVVLPAFPEHFECWRLSPHDAFLYTFTGRVFDFACGIFLALQLKKKKIQTGNTFWKTYCGLFLILISISIVAMIGDDRNHMSGIHLTEGVAINNFLLPLAVTLFLSGLLSEKTVISRFLSTRLLKALGKGSYAFYLIHISFISANLEKWIGIDWVVLIAMQIIAYLIFRLIEEPIHKKFRVNLQQAK